MTAPVQSASELLPVEQPSLGLYLDRDELAVDPRALVAGSRNVRIRDGALHTDLLGWEPFVATSLGERITGIEEFFTRAGVKVTLIGTDEDLAEYDPASGGSLKYVTPRYQVGTAACSGTAVTGTGTAWNTPDPNRAGLNAARVGDEIHFGATDQRDPGAVWHRVAAVGSDTGLTLEASAGTIGDGPYTLRQRFGGTDGLPWYGDEFENAQGTLRDPANAGAHNAGDDLCYLTNGAALVSFKIGQNECARLDLGLTCKTLRRHKNAMFYGDLVVAGSARPSSIRVSEIAEPENVTTGAAAEFALSDAPESVVRFEPLGDVLHVYMRRFDHQSGTVVQLQRVEAPVSWAIRTGAADVSILAGRCVVNLGNFHQFLSADAAYAFDGVQLIEHAGHVLRPLLRKIDGTRLEQALAIRDYEHGEVLWVLPLTTDPAGVPMDAWIEHYREGRRRGQQVPFGHRDLPATAVGYYTQISGIRFSDLLTAPADWFSRTELRWNTRAGSPGFPLLVFGTDAGALKQLGTASTQDGAFAPSRARFPLAAVVPRSGGSIRGLIQRLTPFFRYSAGSQGVVRIVVRAVQDRGQPAAEVQSVAHPLDGSKRHAPIRRMARLAGVEFQVDAASGVYTLDGYHVRVARAGER
jgi:hypothetical protein